MNNPLQKYFRKPSVHIKLLSGDESYGDDVLKKNPTGEHPVYAMNALDEVTARTPDALFNGSATADIIASCVPDFVNPWEIKVQDLDMILIAIRIASGDGSMDISSACPKCNEIGDYSVNLGGLLSTLKSSDYNTPFTINDLEIKFRSITYKEINDISKKQFDIQKSFEGAESSTDIEFRNAKAGEMIKALNELTIFLLALSIEYIKTPEAWVDDKNHIFDFLQQCDRKIHNAIRDHATKLRESSTIKPMKIQCVHCSHGFDQIVNMNVSDFFE